MSEEPQVGGSLVVAIPDVSQPVGGDPPINQFNPLANPDTTAAAGAIQGVRAGEVVADKAGAPKKQGFLGKLGDFVGLNKSYSSTNEQAALTAYTQAGGAGNDPGLGFMPAEAREEQVPPPVANSMPGMNPLLTSPVPHVSKEASAAELAASRTLTPAGMGEAIETSNKTIVEPIPEVVKTPNDDSSAAKEIGSVDVETVNNAAAAGSDNPDIPVFTPSESLVPADIPTAFPDSLSQPAATSPSLSGESTIPDPVSSAAPEPDSIPTYEAGVPATSTPAVDVTQPSPDAWHVDATTPHAEAPVVSEPALDSKDALAGLSSTLATDASGTLPLERRAEPLAAAIVPEKDWKPEDLATSTEQTPVNSMGPDATSFVPPVAKAPVDSNPGTLMPSAQLPTNDVPSNTSATHSTVAVEQEQSPDQTATALSGSSSGLAGSETPAVPEMPQPQTPSSEDSLAGQTPKTSDADTNGVKSSDSAEIPIIASTDVEDLPAPAVEPTTVPQFPASETLDTKSQGIEPTTTPEIQPSNISPFPTVEQPALTTEAPQATSDIIPFPGSQTQATEQPAFMGSPGVPDLSAVEPTAFEPTNDEAVNESTGNTGKPPATPLPQAA